MKVLHINNYLEKGGAETVFRNTIQALNQIDFIENYCFYAGTNIDKLPVNLCKEFYITENIHESKSFKSILKYIYNPKNSRLLTKILVNIKPNIIHVHGYLSSLSLSILISLKKFKKLNKQVRIVQTVHDFHLICPNGSAFNFSNNKPCIDCINSRYKFKIFYKNCDYRGIFYSYIKGLRSLILSFINPYEIFDIFLCPSNFLKNLLIKAGIDKRKILLLRNPVFLKKTGNTDFKNKENIIVYYGRFSPEKNISILIKALSKLKGFINFKLYLIGDGPDIHKIKKEIKKFKIEDNTLILPFLDHDELFVTIEKAKINVIPSLWYETFGLTIFEGILYGLYPIVSEKGALEESIRLINIGETFNPYNHNELKNKILNAINNYERLIPQIKRAQCLILNEFNLYTYTKSLIKVYTNTNNDIYLEMNDFK